MKISLDIEPEICLLADQETTGYTVSAAGLDRAFTGRKARMHLAGPHWGRS